MCPFIHCSIAAIILKISSFWNIFVKFDISNFCCQLTVQLLSLVFKTRFPSTYPCSFLSYLPPRKLNISLFELFVFRIVIDCTFLIYMMVNKFCFYFCNFLIWHRFSVLVPPLDFEETPHQKGFLFCCCCFFQFRRYSKRSLALTVYSFSGPQMCCYGDYLFLWKIAY